MVLINNLTWLLLTLVPLAWLQIQLHREVQLFFLLVTRSYKFTILLFSLVFFPGVLLHELSHFLMAKLLRVRTGRFSVFPRDFEADRLQLGFVEIAVADPVRESMIGAAPLLTGGVFVAYAGLVRLGLDEIWATSMQQGAEKGMTQLITLFERPDVWLWLYLALTISSTMFPSASDRRPIIKIGIAIAIIIGVGLVFGAGYWLLDLVGPGLTRILGAAAVIFGISVGLHLILLVPLRLLRWIFEKLFGVRVRAP